MVSIITPVLNERGLLPEYCKQLSKLKGEYECIIVDGGSNDGSVELLLKQNEIQLVRTAKGRGHQMNTGALAARGDILVFLHADTFLPANAIQLIEMNMQQEHIVGGCFQLQFDQDHPILNYFSSLSRFNHSLFTYGDQCLFIKKNIFMELGMYKTIPIMEDVDIQSRLRRRGTFIQLPEKVTTSARRFQKYGIVRQFLKDILLVGLYKLGISPTYLKRYYPDP